jgi:hypothetical protein
VDHIGNQTKERRRMCGDGPPGSRLEHHTQDLHGVTSQKTVFFNFYRVYITCFANKLCLIFFLFGGVGLSPH